jgi:hypothetical protein
LILFLSSNHFHGCFLSVVFPYPTWYSNRMSYLTLGIFIHTVRRFNVVYLIHWLMFVATNISLTVFLQWLFLHDVDLVYCEISCDVTKKLKVTVNFTLEQAMKAQRGSRGIAVLFL